MKVKSGYVTCKSCKVTLSADRLYGAGKNMCPRCGKRAV